MSDVSERQQIVDVLMATYPIFPRSTIDRLVTAELETYRAATVRTFVPILVQRAIGIRLRDADSLPAARTQARPIVDLRLAGQVSGRRLR